MFKISIQAVLENEHKCVKSSDKWNNIKCGSCKHWDIEINAWDERTAQNKKFVGKS